MAISLAMFFSCLMKTNFQSLKVAEWKVERRSWPGISHQGLRVIRYLPNNLTAPGERAAMGGYRLLSSVQNQCPTYSIFLHPTSRVMFPNDQSDEVTALCKALPWSPVIQDSSSDAWGPGI